MGQSQIHVDALVVGAGFGGIYQLYSLRKLGLSVQVIDMAGDVGGTWYWNKYPGAMSDTESWVYRYSWDQLDLQTYPWTHHYVKQPEVLAYLEHIVDKHDLRKHMQFNTELLAAQWDDFNNVWQVEVSTGRTIVTRYLVTALGLLSKQNYPDIKGLETFKGELVHTAAWRKGLDCTGKRVGVIGCGSTGIQVITDIAKRVESLTCFQRHPQYSVPSGDKVVDPELRSQILKNYDAMWDSVNNSVCGFGFQESTIPTMSVSAEKREQIFQDCWDQGNGFRFMFGGFNDISTNVEANEEACKFIRKKISEIVKDPEKARKLTPSDLYARRPLCDGGYYQQFNRENVHLVDLKEAPITEVNADGILTGDGVEHKLDLIIFATGFDAVEGNYTRVRIRGKSGKTLKQHWEGGPSSYLGVSISDFPNMFMITGPNGPFTNIPPAIETHVQFITQLITNAEKIRADGAEIAVEATPQAELEWGEICEEAASGSLFKLTDSWLFGSNVPGKKRQLRFFFGGLQNYRKRLQDVISDGYRGYRPFPTVPSPDKTARVVHLREVPQVPT